MAGTASDGWCGAACEAAAGGVGAGGGDGVGAGAGGGDGVGTGEAREETGQERRARRWGWRGARGDGVGELRLA